MAQKLSLDSFYVFTSTDSSESLDPPVSCTDGQSS